MIGFCIVGSGVSSAVKVDHCEDKGQCAAERGTP
jgi:hypothetical protein